MPSAPSHEEATCPACRGPTKDLWTHLLLAVPHLPSGMGAQPSCKVLLCPWCKEEGHTDPVTVPVPLGTLEEMHCEEHGEKVCFFCGHDAQLLCTRCREGPSHHTHAVGFLDGACQPNQDGVRTQLEALRVEGEEIEDIKSREDQKFQMLLTHIEIRKQQVEAVFEKLQQELREQRGLLLARLRGLEVQVCEEREDYISKFSEEVARHRAEAEELENCQQLASVLLHDVGVSQSRCEKTFVSPETISPALVEKIRDVHRKILPLPEMLRTFSESLVHHLETDSGLQGFAPAAPSAQVPCPVSPAAERDPAFATSFGRSELFGKQAPNRMKGRGGSPRGAGAESGRAFGSPGAAPGHTHGSGSQREFEKRNQTPVE
ncbi:LOW QUALITY PROTEIN: tripartite motif-containing protein 15-like [Puma concolor]|uniref:LOW QUALITY PROTEIN: tripartite motif-containing protein 15-like n=1 Tax=Puma concolor TaxID=9696 RepID=A0A6P6HCF3_PUMCO|nr:LOW QUALITY PROTEIN: tripartite motif-containing protein 15-like [Puma concolor]